MKRYFIVLLLTLSFIIYGCGTTDTITGNSKKEMLNLQTPSPEISTQQATSNVESTNEVSTSSTFKISASDIAHNIYGKDVELFSKSVAGYDVDIFPNGSYLLFCVSSKEDDFPMLIYAYDQSKCGTPESAQNLIQPFIDTLSPELDIQCAAYNVSNSGRQILYCAWVKNSNAKEFPFTIQILPDTDYFLHADIDEYKNACTEGRYNDILSDVQAYIADVNPPEYDNAYILQTILLPICENWESIDVRYDDIEKNATFFYSGLNSITENTHFVPYAKTNEKEIHSLIGFYAPDWLFFDNIIISSDENINISTSKNKIEEVIAGGTIYEAYDVSLDDDTLEQLCQSQNHTLRFKGKNDNYKDYEMTATEYEALITISKFQNVRNILSDLLFHFQKRQS
ncbi:hypothetical protein AALB47_11580 [Lachnospiraceae bacterium 54-11]